MFPRRLRVTYTQAPWHGTRWQVLTEQYRAIPSALGPGGGSGKLLALDEAHKFMDGMAADGLSEAIVNVARLMRHDGMRLAVSTQSPAALAPELLELVTIAVLHRFHSRDWCAPAPTPDPGPAGGKSVTIYEQLMVIVRSLRSCFDCRQNSLLCRR